MNLLQTVLSFLVVLGTLVIVHELGHYLVARWCGVKVLRFSVGMGKIVWSRRFGRDRTEWAVSVLPLGGYVKMLDAREQDVHDLPPEDLKREFTAQSVWKRIAIVAAGPIANFLLAIFVFTGLYMHGIPEPTPRLRSVPEQTAARDAGLHGGELITAVNGEPIRTWTELRWRLLQSAVDKLPVKLDTQRVDPADPPGRIVDTVTLKLDSLSTDELEGDFMTRLGMHLAGPKAILMHVIPGGAGARAGLRANDRVLAIAGKAVEDSIALIRAVSQSPGKPLVIKVLRDGAEVDLAVTPDAVTERGKTVGRIQVELPPAPEMIVVSDAPGTAFAKSVASTWEQSCLIVKMLGKMIIGQVSWKNITGPITIADYAGKTASLGLPVFLNFIAFISISLGVMNLLPIPVLDGGLLLYYSLEVLTGRPVPERFGEIAQRAGLGILVTLMVVAMFNDIVRLMS
jgi:regulator of sigma E protease